MQETTTIKLEGVVFSNSSFNKAKMQVFARRFNVELDINNKPIQITGTWHAISQFREVLRTEISELCSNSASKAAVLLVEANENDITHSVANSTKGRLNVSSFSPDVLFLMQKCGVYQNDHLTYDTKGGCVIIECPADDEAASVIAEEFQSEYRQLMMSQKLKEYTFPILNISSNQQIEKLVSQFNADFNQSIFTYNEETKVIKCLSMSARQFNHIKAKVTELLQQSEPAAVNPTSKFTNSSEADTPSSMSITVTGGRKITLKHADIVEEAVDAIVNAANDKLQHAGGVALAINKASQGVVQVLSNAIIQKYNYIATGAAVHTAAGGALKCKYVIHTVGPEQRVHRNQTEHLLWSACISTLQVAEKLSVSSIAIPPISSGVFGVPKDVVAKTIVQAVCTYHVHTEGILQDVRIVIIDKETYLAFKPFFTNAKVVFDGNAVVTQPQSSALPHNLQQSHSKGKEMHTDGLCINFYI